MFTNKELTTNPNWTEKNDVQSIQTDLCFLIARFGFFVTMYISLTTLQFSYQIKTGESLNFTLKTFFTLL